MWQRQRWTIPQNFLPWICSAIVFKREDDVWLRNFRAAIEGRTDGHGG